MQIPLEFMQAQPESQSQTQSQTQPESQIPLEIVRVFREIFFGSTTPPHPYLDTSQLTDSESSSIPADADDFETLPEAVRAFRDMFGSTTPPDSYFGISPKMEAGSIPRVEGEDTRWFGEESEGIESGSVAADSEVCNIEIVGFCFTLTCILAPSPTPGPRTSRCPMCARPAQIQVINAAQIQLQHHTARSPSTRISTIKGA